VVDEGIHAAGSFQATVTMSIRPTMQVWYPFSLSNSMTVAQLPVRLAKMFAPGCWPTFHA
jgi:hypothetical protein